MSATSDYDYALWLLGRLHSDRSAVQQISAMIAAKPGDTDEVLRARRSLEGMLHLDVQPRITGRVYAQVAAAFADEGRPTAASAFRAIAEADRELAEAEEHWANRYAGKGIGRGLSSVDARKVRRTGMVSRGIDGAIYVEAEFLPQASAEATPALTITNSVLVTELVEFPDGQARTEWLADRSLSRPGVPLSSCVNGPACRTALEERVLAWLLQREFGSADPWPELRENTFTADSRSEILLAWRDLAARTDRRDDWLVEAALASRLLRAPAWADDDIGPYGATASLYLYRLAQTQVARRAAESAAEWLIDHDRPGPPRPVESLRLPPPRVSPEDLS